MNYFRREVIYIRMHDRSIPSPPPYNRVLALTGTGPASHTLFNKFPKQHSSRLFP